MELTNEMAFEFTAHGKGLTVLFEGDLLQYLKILF
jgi:hypothetical protein